MLSIHSLVYVAYFFFSLSLPPYAVAPEYVRSLKGEAASTFSLTHMYARIRGRARTSPTPPRHIFRLPCVVCIHNAHARTHVSPPDEYYHACVSLTSRQDAQSEREKGKGKGIGDRQINR